MIVVLLLAQIGASPSTPLVNKEKEIVELLRELKPLQKIHYSWPLPTKILDNPNDPRYREYVRLTHAACFGDAVTASQVGAAVIVCQTVNQGNPKIRASLGINYSPWHRGFGENPPTESGLLQLRELERFEKTLSDIKTWLSVANSRHDCNVELTAVMLDTECFHIRENDKLWNDSITRKHNLIYDISKKVFPEAMVIRYGRGIQRVNYGTGWDHFKYYTFAEKGDCFSCALYRVPEIGQMRETFRRTFELAKLHGSEIVVPTVALGAGYRRKVEKYQEWQSDWDFDPVYSWSLGAELNHPWFAARPQRYAPWGAAKYVKFYPAPFNEKTPSWIKHFIAYVRGANMVKELPEPKLFQINPKNNSGQ